MYLIYVFNLFKNEKIFLFFFFDYIIFLIIFIYRIFMFTPDNL